MSWFVYVLQCSDNTLYTGVTNDLERRLEAHQKGVGSKYTRGRIPVHLLAYKELPNRSEAQSIEHQVKNLNRKRKLQLIAQWQSDRAGDGI